MLRVFLYATVAMLLTACPSAMLGTAVLGSSIADERTIGMQIDDIAITSKIMARLTAEKDMPSRWLSVDSIEGKVSLMGHLKNQEQINRAVFIANSFQGVKSVHSEIKIGEPSLKSMMTDSWITTRIKTRLLKHPKTSGVSVHVETIEGRVYLQGMVRNDDQYQQALELASTTPGVNEVVDMLKINPHGTASRVDQEATEKRFSGSRKKYGSKAKIKPKALPRAEFSEVFTTNQVSDVKMQAETIPLSDLRGSGDIFEETVSAIKRKPEPKIKPYEGDSAHSNDEPYRMHQFHSNEEEKKEKKSSKDDDSNANDEEDLKSQKNRL